MPSQSMEEEELQPKFNIKFHSIEGTTTSPFTDHFVGYTTPSFKGGLVRSDPGGMVLYPAIVDHAEKLYQFRPRENDVWILTFPKCGTTWMQELVWLLVNNCDIGAAKKTFQYVRSPFLEMPYMMQSEKSKETVDDFVTMEKMDKIPMSQRRIIKTHLPFQMLNPRLLDTSKVVYVARNPKDAIVSFYYHHTLFQKFYNYKGDLSQFARYFMNDLVVHAPFFTHVLDAWSKRYHPNLLFIFYEDLKRDLRGQIIKVAEFLNRPLTAGELEKMKEHLRFSNFANNPMINCETWRGLGLLKDDGHFMRKGKTGDWKNHFNPELNEEIDRWIKYNLKDSDLKFSEELDDQD